MQPLRSFVVLSLTLHLGVGLYVVTRPKAARHEAPEVADRFAGRGIEVDAVSLPKGEAEAPALAEPAEPATPVAPVVPESPHSSSPPAMEKRASSRPGNTERAQAKAKTASDERPDRTSAPQSGKTPAAHAERASSAPDQAEPTAAAAAASDGFGSVGLPLGVRHLPNAFTRALAIANRGDRRWSDLPFGRAGEAHLRLNVSPEGELGELEYPNEAERDALAPVVRHLFDNTLLLLRAGRFSLDPRKLSSGVARLRVMVEVTEREGANPEGDPSELFGVSWEAPRTDKPGKSGFILNSGRQVTAWVWLEH